MPESMPATSRLPFATRNVVLIATALVTIGAGYAVLSAGHPSAAAVLLVLGYCVLLPVGIAL